ncbi:Rieske 2Fe-2S domain-containing protein [Archangium primigenium]|uniref:Rieske 2Fe-2S domain-containing protein n=1 Tax=[Archangium] primigenium TaxID=2792470 RepID=UPI00195BA6A0|nr:Rieske 2Fe-2S domain-containing protein [Archangium primigenium]MBM7118722.1 Rieske 2Fe-2S domain-containing protein [Archangium primigenium]
MAVNVAASAHVPRHPESPWFRAWYAACASEDLRPGQVRAWSLAGRELVLFRTESGQVQALAAHCPHMGAHLARGTVVGECLRCPLHHLAFDGRGVCHPPRRLSQRAFPVVERHGNVLVFNGPVVLFPPPQVGPPALRWRAAPPVTVKCGWLPLVTNAFDIEHLRTVHLRELREPPRLERPDAFTLRLRFTSRVTGNGLSDRMMKALSGDHIRVTLTLYGGSLLAVESDLGRVRGALLAAFLPHPEGTQVTLSVASPPSLLPGLAPARLALSRWLYTAFLHRDLSVLEGMRFQSAAAREDPVLRPLLDFIAQLPEDPDDAPPG